MTRETRLVVILVGFGAAGVGALAFVAHQYERALGPRAEAKAASSAPADAAAAMPFVDALIAVREAEAAAAARQGVQPDDRTFPEETLAACRVARLSAGADHGIDDATYMRLSDAWRAWSRGEPVEAALAAAFEARRPATSRENLGRYDALDAAIKR